VLVVGGAGHVGRPLSALLAAEGHEVVVAGRSLDRASEAADAVPGAQARRIDVGDARSVDAALKDVTMVYACVDQPTADLLDAVIDRGHTLVDISADSDAINRGLTASARAEQAGARILMAAGLQPGLSNVLVRQALAQVPDATRVTTVLLLSAGDSFGPAAVEFMLDAGSRPPADHPTSPPLRGFSNPLRVDLGAPFGRRLTVRFPFPDEAPNPPAPLPPVEARLAFHPGWTTGAVALLGATHVTSLGRYPRARRLLARWTAALGNRLSGDDVALVAIASSPKATAHVWARGQGESQVTAIATALMGRTATEMPPGVRLPHDVIAPEPFLADLERSGIEVASTATALGGPTT
jgi:short subunit dehydrogenase-like uncharacterized protein